jgi:DNA-binding GntR family transcriptional regulator
MSSVEQQVPPLVQPPTFSREWVSVGITSYLRDLILSGQMKPDAPLRVEHLAADLGVSVTPVRESLQELLGEGFVIRMPRRGYAVALLTREDIQDTFFVNGMLSGELAARAAKRIDNVSLEHLEQLETSLIAAAEAGSYADMEGLNHRLHRLINQVAGAHKLAWFVQRTSHYAPRWSWQFVEGWPAASASDHRPIVEALRAHDPEAARAAMQDHMRHSGELLVKHLAKQGFWDADA